MYNETSSDFKKVTTEADFIAYMSGVSRKLGQFKSGKESGWRTFTGLSGRQFVIAFDSTFEQGDAKETFTWRIQQGKAILLGYNINSNVFITK